MDRVDGVQPEAVDVELVHPDAAVLDDVAPHARAALAVVVDRGAPGRRHAVGEVRAELGEVVALGTEVIVDDVEEHRDAAGVTGIHQAAQAARPAVGGLGGEEVDAVVAPVARAGKLGDRHELERGDAEVRQRREVGDDRLEGAGGREGADVDLIEDQVGEVAAPELLVRPHETARVHDDRRAVDALGLPARGRIGPVPRAVEPVAIPGALRQPRDGHPEEAGLARREGLGADPLEHEFHRAAAGRPDREGDGLPEKACAQHAHTLQ